MNKWKNKIMQTQIGEWYMNFLQHVYLSLVEKLTMIQRFKVAPVWIQQTKKNGN